MGHSLAKAQQRTQHMLRLAQDCFNIWFFKAFRKVSDGVYYSRHWDNLWKSRGGIVVNGAPREVLNGVPREYIECPLGVFWRQTRGRIQGQTLSQKPEGWQAPRVSGLKHTSTPVHQHTTLLHSYSTSTSVNDLHSHSAWQRNSWTLLAFIFLDYSVFTAYSISWICLKIKMQSLLQWIEGLRDYKWNVLKHLFYTSSKISKAAKLGLVGCRFGGRRPQKSFFQRPVTCW